ncbi:MAG: endonuclease III [Gammaproteobacteria bacterium]|nr:endonuclease III [Gammaproteobacteria bacterium]
MTKAKIEKILTILRKAIPNPKSELEYKTPFELLVAVILSAQATDVSVNKATSKLFPVANTPEKILALGETRFKNHIKTIGLYNAKAKNILKTCAILSEQYNSQVPKTREELESLPGVGRKTANVILNVAFNQPTIAVDTHIFRVCNRTKIAPGKTPLAIEQKLLSSVTKPFLQDTHHLLLLHGRYTCTARDPHCAECVINKLCEYEYKDSNEINKRQTDSNSML